MFFGALSFTGTKNSQVASAFHQLVSLSVGPTLKGPSQAKSNPEAFASVGLLLFLVFAMPLGRVCTFVYLFLKTLNFQYAFYVTLHALFQTLFVNASDMSYQEVQLLSVAL